MCRVYNKIGALISLKEGLDQYNITDFKSVKDVIDFKKAYVELKDQILILHKDIISKEKDLLGLDLPKIQRNIMEVKESTADRLSEEFEELNRVIYSLKSDKPKKLIPKILNDIRILKYKRKLKSKENNFSKELLHASKKLQEEYDSKHERFLFIESSFDKAVNLSAKNSIYEIDRKKSIVDKLNNYIYGAIGEQKVVKALEDLSDDFVLINDFTYNFSPPIFNKRTNEYIKSIQIDHLLIGPSGLIIIETKNWSKNSIDNSSLRSPIEQIQRANFALYHLIKNKLDIALDLNSHHWGEKKIPIKNLIVLINGRLNVEFQYVKVLNLSELLGYVKYFKPILSPVEVENISQSFLTNNRNGV